MAGVGGRSSSFVIKDTVELDQVASRRAVGILVGLVVAPYSLQVLVNSLLSSIHLPMDSSCLKGVARPFKGCQTLGRGVSLFLFGRRSRSANQSGPLNDGKVSMCDRHHLEGERLSLTKSMSWPGLHFLRGRIPQAKPLKLQA